VTAARAGRARPGVSARCMSACVKM
jgi:hypothetical protein